MKVTRATPKRLVIKETMLGLRLLSFITTLTGFYIFISFEYPADLFGGLCIAIASLINVISPTEISTFDKTIDRITLYRLRGFKASVSHYKMSTVADAAVKRNSLLGLSFYQVELLFQDGRRMPINHSISTDVTQQAELANEITNFVHRRPKLNQLAFENIN